MEKNKAIELANKAIQVYKKTPIEKYPEARARDYISDHASFGSYEFIQANNLLQAYFDLLEVK